MVIEKVDNLLRQKVSHLEVGKRLPPVRELKRELNISQTVLDKVLTRLQAEGLVESRPRSGFYRIEEQKPVHQLITFLFFEDPTSLKPGHFANEFLGYLTGTLPQGAVSIQVRLMRQEPNWKAVVEDIVKRESSMVITYGIDAHHLYLVHELVEREISCLHLFSNLEKLISPGLVIQNEQVVRAQVEHLIGLGHRRIAFLHAAVENEYYRDLDDRLDGFYRLAMEYQLEVLPEWVCWVGWEHSYIRNQVHQIMTAEKKPTALIIYDSHVNPVYAELRACGFEPGKNVSVVGTDDMPWAAHVEPPLTTLRVPRIRAGTACCEMMELIRAKQDPGIRFLGTNLVVRQSTCAIK